MGRTEKKAANLSTPRLVGAPCFSRGDFSPADKSFISKEWALALVF
jgi:hypothetical protein